MYVNNDRVQYYVLPGICSSQTFCVARGTKEAKVMQGMLLIIYTSKLIISSIDGKRELITVMECISAIGEARNPTILLKGKTFQSRWLKHRIRGASYGNTARGWMNNEEALIWLGRYAKETKP